MTQSPPIEDVRAILAMAARAEDEDGAAPLDEATTMALRAGAVDAHLVHGGFTLLRDGELTLVVDPPERDAGLGRLLLERLLTSYDGPLGAWSHGNLPAAARLAETHDFARVRDLWVMRRRTSEPLVAAKAIPGVTIRAFEEADTEAVLALNAAAFASHPEQGAMDADDFAARMAEPWFDPAGLLVAVDDDGRLLGFHWTKRHSHEVGEVYVVGVSPTAQGRGLGKALTLAGLHHLDGRRVEEVILYVESDNEPAIRLYSGLGFTHGERDTHVMYRRGR